MTNLTTGIRLQNRRGSCSVLLLKSDSTPRLQRDAESDQTDRINVEMALNDFTEFARVRKPSERRLSALTRKCPNCGSPVGVNCAGVNGSERISVHRERLVSKSFARLRARYPKAAEFYLTDEWRRVRYQALRKHGGACQCCGRRATPGSPLHVDHIKPRSRFPELALDVNNLQVLCADCNLGKSASDTRDWRP